LEAILQRNKTTPRMAKYKFTQSQFDEISLLLKRRPSEGVAHEKSLSSHKE